MPDQMTGEAMPSERRRRFHLRFPARPLAVRDALRAALARYMRLLSEEESGTLELILAELFNNISEHSYHNTGDGEITLTIASDAHDLHCHICDDGPPLPASCLIGLERPDPHNLPEGGFGWYLIRDLAQDLQYRRDGARNILSFRLPFGEASEEHQEEDQLS